MAANPMTDQVLARLKHVRSQIVSTPQPILDTYDEFAHRIVDGLPGVDPTIIGEVLLHAGGLYSTLVANGMSDGYLSASAVLPVRILTEAGCRLYAPDGLR